MRKFPVKIIEAWDRFWFAPQAPDTFCLYRIFFGFFVFLLLCLNFPNVERFYGPQGIIDHSYFLTMLDKMSWQTSHRFSLLSISSSVTFVWLLYWIGILSAITFAVGYKTRASNIILFVVFTSFFHRNPYLLNGQENLGNLLLFLGCFTPMGHSYSLDARIRKARMASAQAGSAQDSELVSVWAWRLMQISLTLMYFLGGVTKLYDPVWRDGSALYFLSLDDEWFRFPDTDFLHNETLGYLQTYGALAIECAFPILVWIPRLKLAALCAYWFLHLGIMLLLGQAIAIFNFFLIGTLTLFLPPQTTRKAFEYIRARAVQRTASEVRQ